MTERAATHVAAIGKESTALESFVRFTDCLKERKERLGKDNYLQQSSCSRNKLVHCGFNQTIIALYDQCFHVYSLKLVNQHNFTLYWMSIKPKSLSRDIFCAVR